MQTEKVRQKADEITKGDNKLILTPVGGIQWHILPKSMVQCNTGWKINPSKGQRFRVAPTDRLVRLGCYLMNTGQVIAYDNNKEIVAFIYNATQDLVVMNKGLPVIELIVEDEMSIK